LRRKAFENRWRSFPALPNRQQRYLLPLKSDLDPGQYTLRARVEVGNEIQEATAAVKAEVPQPAVAPEGPPKAEDQSPAPPAQAKPPVAPVAVPPQQAHSTGNTVTSPAVSAPRIGSNQGTPSRAAVPSAEAHRHNLTGRQLTQAGQYREANAELTEALRLAPGYPHARGYAWYLLRNYAASIQELTEAIRLNPNYLNAYTVRAMAKKAAGDITGAAADMKRVKELSH
jgi:tetratricopeptide (TPR) repeat protein